MPSRQYYSRLQRLEEKRNIRSAIVFGGLTLAFILLMLFFGIPLIAKFASVLTDIRGSALSVDKNDTTPPAPPRIDPLPEYTSNQNLEIKGATEPGITITLIFNNESTDLISNADGNFTKNYSLQKGENTFLARAKDKAGNESVETKKFTIVFDKEPPQLEVREPSDGASFFGDKQKNLTIKGQTDSSATLTVNERIIFLDNDGNFSFSQNLGQGENSFNFKSKDKAGNVTETTIKVNFSS